MSAGLQEHSNAKKREPMQFKNNKTKVCASFSNYV